MASTWLLAYTWRLTIVSATAHIGRIQRKREPFLPVIESSEISGIPGCSPLEKMAGTSRKRKSSSTGKTLQADKDEQHPSDEAEAEAEIHPKGDSERIQINRAPVLTMWAAVVAEREGYSYQEGLSFGKAIAGMLAHAKGLRLGIYEKEPQEDVGKKRKTKQERFDVFGMKIAGKTTKEGLRLAVQNNKPISPSSVESYLRRAFGSNYERVKEAMQALAKAYLPERIGLEAYSLYEKLRPQVAGGVRGWGAKGFLDLGVICQLQKEAGNACH